MMDVLLGLFGLVLVIFLAVGIGGALALGVAALAVWIKDLVVRAVCRLRSGRGG